MKSKKPRAFMQSGQVARLLLVLAIIVIVAAFITFLILQMAQKPSAPPKKQEHQVPQPVYETTLGSIRFVFESALDKGNVLTVSEITNPQYQQSFQKDLPTTEKFIEVTVGAQNKGTVNTEQNAWNLENIVDSQGRNFVPLDGYAIAPWLPENSQCGALLKPAFDPTPCTKIYEVSKESQGLKIRVITGKDNSANNLSSGKTDSTLIDLIVK